MNKGKRRMDEETRRELRRKLLCFTCKEPWELGYKCMRKCKAHYIEVISDDEDEEYFGHLQNMEENPPRIDPTMDEEGEEADFGLVDRSFSTEVNSYIMKIIYVEDSRVLLGVFKHQHLNFCKRDLRTPARVIM
jgi:hypothetical protein